jgi:selenocysteine lyase/cysteine desulfurase
MSKLINIRSEFDLPDNFSYLNCSTMGPQPKSSTQKAMAIMKQKEQPWHFTQAVFFENAENLRQELSGLLNAPADHFAIIPSVGYGITTAATILSARRPAGEILLLDEQFPSNVYPWRELRKHGFAIKTLKRDLGRDLCDQVLEAVDDKVSIVAVPNVHWSDGQLLDLERLSSELRSKDVALLIDAVQSTGVYPTDISKLKPDFLVTGFYKWMLGPYGLSAMYVDEKFFDADPLEQAWMNREGAEDLHGLTEYTDNIKPTAARFDQGGKSFVNAALAAESVRHLRAWGTKAMSEHAGELTSLIGERLAEAGYGVLSKELRCPHILGVLARKGEWPEDIVQKLHDRGVSVALRGQRLRISPNAYNTRLDAEKLIEVLPEVT